MATRKLALVMALTLVLLATLAWAEAVVDTTGVAAGGLGGPVNEKDLMVLAIPALVWVLKQVAFPTDPNGKIVGKWKRVAATLPVVLAILYTWYRSGNVGLVSTGAGVILGVSILGGRNWLNKIRGK